MAIKLIGHYWNVINACLICDILHTTWMLSMLLFVAYSRKFEPLEFIISFLTYIASPLYFNAFTDRYKKHPFYMWWSLCLFGEDHFRKVDMADQECLRDNNYCFGFYKISYVPDDKILPLVLEHQFVPT